MKLPKTAHTSRPWRVHEITKDFELEDVWRLPTPGGPDDLARVVEWFTTPREDPFLLRALFALRWKLGALFGWDRPGSGVGGRVPSLRERLPADLLEAPRGPDLRAVPAREAADGPPIFSSLYQTNDEWATEFANKTVHSVMHIGWVPDDSGRGYHAQMAVLVKPNGPLGKAYMAAIKPFRYALVYPLLLRSIGRDWQRQAVARGWTLDFPPGVKAYPRAMTMGCCATTTRVESVFNAKLAACDLRRYRKKGPRRSTRLLLDALKAEGLEGKTLLDIGGGVGVIQHELLDAGAASAASVEASRPYLEVAKEESVRRGHQDRADFRHGDFVDLAAEVADADVVTLDRVICCYPDVEALVSQSAARARVFYGLVYPRDTRLVRLGFATVNLLLGLLRKPMRAFVHRVEDVERLVEAAGLSAHRGARAGVWQVALYRRTASPAADAA